MKPSITYKTASTLVRYDCLTGVLRWNKSRPGHAQSGCIAGRISSSGYWHICLLGKEYQAHRLAWFLVNKKWPEGPIDHINGDRQDNRIENLREATHGGNCSNCGLYKNNKSGSKGVSFRKKSRKWVAQIQKDKTKIHIGYFDKVSDAESAYSLMAEVLFGDFKRRTA